MPTSLSSMIKKLHHIGKITKEEQDSLLKKLEGHDKKLREEAYMRGYNDGMYADDDAAESYE